MKKVLLMSDSHWNDSILKVIIDKYKDEVDLLIHCGDIRMMPEELKALSPVPVYLVKGNNDFHSNAERELLVEIEGHTCLVVHGHRQNIKECYDDLISYAQTKGADVVFYGHTHIHHIEKRDGVLIMNPGSLEADDYGTYMIVDFLENGKIEPHLHRVKEEFGIREGTSDYEESVSLGKVFREFLNMFRGK